jgi:hypothetical protein
VAVEEVLAVAVAAPADQALLSFPMLAHNEEQVVL